MQILVVFEGLGFLLRFLFFHVILNLFPPPKLPILGPSYDSRGKHEIRGPTWVNF